MQRTGQATHPDVLAVLLDCLWASGVMPLQQYALQALEAARSQGGQVFTITTEVGAGYTCCACMGVGACVSVPMCVWGGKVGEVGRGGEMSIALSSFLLTDSQPRW